MRSAAGRIHVVLVLLAGFGLAGCLGLTGCPGQQAPAPMPSGDSPALSMDDAHAPRPPVTVPPPPPPAPVPGSVPGAVPADPASADQNGLSAAFSAAKKDAVASRTQAQDQPLLSVPLKQLLGPSGQGVHLFTKYNIRAADGAEYSLSAQSSRLGKPRAGYLVFYREGMRAPLLVDLKSLRDKVHGVVVPALFAGSVDEIDVEGRRFGVVLNADTTDNIMSEIQLWPVGDESHPVKFTISAAFAAVAAAAAASFKIGSADVRVIAYQDYGGGSSISLCVHGDAQRVPMELLARPDGKLVSAALPKMSQRLGLRVTGSGAEKVLQVYDLAKSGKSLGQVPLESLVKTDDQ